MTEQPPSIVKKLLHTIEHGSEEEAVAAKERLQAIQASGGRAAQAKRKETRARTEAEREMRTDAEITDFINDLLAANAHLAPTGTYPPDIEELLEQYRPE